jgi:hypothetical protein
MDRQPRALDINPVLHLHGFGKDGDGPSRDHRLLDLLETAVTVRCQVGA